MMGSKGPLIFLLLAIIAWKGARLMFGCALVPDPVGTMVCLFHLAATRNFWFHIAMTLFRGGAALALALGLAMGTGIVAGRKKTVMDMIMPLAAVLQATPPIFWITLVLVWAGTGSIVLILVVTVSLFPPLFLSTAMAAADLDPRLFELARVHRVGTFSVIKDIILPGIFPNFLAGFSYALGSCLKIAAVAEFLGADQGMGDRIYWAFRMLDMEALFAWGLVLIGIGTAMDFFCIRPLRERSEKMGKN